MALAALIVSVIALILSGAATWYTRRATLAGELGRLDGLTVTIRDDHPWRDQSTPLGCGPTPEQVAAQIWGPLRFTPGTGPGADPARGVPGADATDRTTPTAGMPVGEELPFLLEPTTPPSWAHQTTQDWRRERGTMLRLRSDATETGWNPGP